MAQQLVIDIGERFTNVGLVALGKNKIDVLALGQSPTIPQLFASENSQMVEKQAQTILDLIHLLKIKEDRVNIVIPDFYVYSQIVDMPKLKEKELLSAIRYQADEFIPMPIDETNIDIEILQEDVKQKKLKILIIAAAKRVVETLYQCVMTAGLEPQSLENELSAALRFASVFDIAPTGLYLFINIGFNSCSVYVFDGTTKKPILTRTIKIGIELFLRDIKINLGLDDQKAVELLRTIGFGQGGSYDIASVTKSVTTEFIQELQKITLTIKDKYTLPIQKVYMYNENHNIAYFAEQIASLTSLPVTNFPLEQFINSSEAVTRYASNLSKYVSIVAGALR